MTNRVRALHPSFISSVRDLVPAWKAHALPAVRVTCAHTVEVGGN